MDTALCDIDPREIPDSVIMETPLVQELSEALEVSKFKLPLVIKNKVLMSEGRWNGKYYSTEAIRKAWKQTDWSNRNVRDLYLDHSDQFAEGVTEWVGEVDNVRMVGDKLVGDLIVHDFPTAVKLQSGKPKVGISPKIHGLCDNWKGEFVDFVFDNFSIVINPAIKTAYINNSQKSEVIQMPVKDVELEEEKEDEKEGTDTEETKESLAKKKKEKRPYPYPEETKEKDKKKKKEKYPYPEEANEMEEDELSAYTDFIAKYLKKNPGKSIKDAAKAWKAQKQEEKMSEAAKLDSKIESLESLLADLKAERSKYEAPENPKLEALEEKMSDIANSISELKEAVTLDTKAEPVPDRRTVNQEGMTGDYEAKLAEIESKGANQALADFMRSQISGVNGGEAR